MNEDDLQRAIREAHEQTATRPIAGPKPTARLEAIKPPHEHTYAVSTSNLTSIRFCATCGKSWLLKAAHHNFKPIMHWEAILETD